MMRDGDAAPTSPAIARAPRKGKRESLIRNEIIGVIARISWADYMKNNTGYAQSLRSGGQFQYGTVGAPDLFVFVAPLGRVVALELKAAWGRSREEQTEWRERHRKVGCTIEEVKGKGDDAVDAACAILMRVHEESLALTIDDEPMRRHQIELARKELATARDEVRRVVARKEERAARPFQVRGKQAKRQHSI